MVKCTAPVNYDALKVLRDTYGIKVSDTSYVRKPEIPQLQTWQQRLHKARQFRGAKPFTCSSQFTNISEPLFYAPPKLTNDDIVQLVITERTMARNKVESDKMVDGLTVEADQLLENQLKNVPEKQQVSSTSSTPWYLKRVLHDNIEEEKGKSEIVNETCPQDEPSRIEFNTGKAQSKTFLTGVDLTQVIPASETLQGIERVSAQNKGNEQGSETDDEENEDDELDKELESFLLQEEKALESFIDQLRFPSSMKASLMLLKHAVNNPMTYWKVIQSGYAQPTFTSRLRTKHPPNAPAEATPPLARRKDSKTTSVRYREAARADMVANYWQAHNEWGDEEVLVDQDLLTAPMKSAIPTWGEKAFPPTCKDFADLEHLMANVDNRILSIQKNIGKNAFCIGSCCCLQSG
jgi:hypothetical protein